MLCVRPGEFRRPPTSDPGGFMPRLALATRGGSRLRPRLVPVLPRRGSRSCGRHRPNRGSVFSAAREPGPRAHAAPAEIGRAAMGNHLADPTGPEFNGERFTHTFIYGSWDDEVTFYE